MDWGQELWVQAVDNPGVKRIRIQSAVVEMKESKYHKHRTEWTDANQNNQRRKTVVRNSQVSELEAILGVALVTKMGETSIKILTLRGS